MAGVHFFWKKIEKKISENRVIRRKRRDSICLPYTDGKLWFRCYFFRVSFDNNIEIKRSKFSATDGQEIGHDSFLSLDTMIHRY
jgi:hypothetical protein